MKRSHGASDYCSRTINSPAGCAEGAATLTANLVDLGYTSFVVGVVLNLIDREKSDIVVQVDCSCHSQLLQSASKSSASSGMSVWYNLQLEAGCVL